ncbi:DUF5000 domain-containing lipoprotein [Niabella aurantiaca]|uniref:DUF5000 domain-containing lipoprotein n=1 Tax=Niabella aurantiaca TaxID=379900 RepID=UPI0008FC195C|nr:DUF5000 domain-containing lipoprotein [Niabella aurantiaca]
MKRKIYPSGALTAVAAVLLSVIAVSCSHKNEFVEMISTDKTKPAPIQEYTVADFNGGSHIVYDLPKVDNILYVKANYDLNGNATRPQETRSSYFSDTITVEGFASAKEYEVKLTVVSRANIESDPVVVKVHPKTPVYQLVAQSLTMTPDFQGVRVQAQNADSKTVGIVFLDDAIGKLSIRQQNFTSFPNISYAVRGYDTIPKQYASYVTDKWGNRSDTIFTTVKPLYEKTLDKTKFSSYALPSETPIYSSSYPLNKLFDGNYSNFWHTTQATSQQLPVYGTFKLGTYVKLSRFKLKPRNPNYEFRHGCPRVFSLWGSDVDNPADFEVPLFAEVGTKIGDWENLGNYTWPNPPSGSAPTAPTAEDKVFFNAGVEFEIPFEAPKVKVLRLVVSETWVPGNFTHAAEIDLFGDDR